MLSDPEMTPQHPYTVQRVSELQAQEPSSKTTGRSIPAAAPSKQRNHSRSSLETPQFLSCASDFDNLVKVAFRLRDEVLHFPH